MPKPKILVQLDTDPQASVFDAVVAIDAGVEHLLQHAAVVPDQVESLVHGAMFTRGPGELHNTAVFVGGSDVTAGEAILKAATACFFGPMRVSVLMDSSGANSTAAAAVVAAQRHIQLQGTKAVVLAATGPVGQRITRLLAAGGCNVNVASRSLARAEALVSRIAEDFVDSQLTAVETSSQAGLRAAMQEAELVFAAGAAGIELLPSELRQECPQLRVAIDLNAVPPVGIAGVDVMDKAKELEGIIAYGAIGVGGTKMKIHKAAIRNIFASNDCVMDIDEIYHLGLELEGS